MEDGLPELPKLGDAYVTVAGTCGKKENKSINYVIQRHYRHRSNTGSCKVLLLKSNVYSKDRTCFFICHPSQPL